MKIPTHIQIKANQLICMYENHEIHARISHKHKYRILEVTLRYRLLNKGKKWELMTHEKYNREVLR
ncbi:ParE family toxin-like protein [Enterovibrio calviensis]